MKPVFYILTIPLSLLLFTISPTSVTAQTSTHINLNISTTNTTPALGESVSFTLEVQGGTAPHTYCWDFGTPATTQKLGEWNHEAKLICYSTDQNPTHTFNQYGQYDVQVFVKDSAGNTAKAIELVNVNVQGTTIDPTQDCDQYNLVGDGLTDNQDFLARCITENPFSDNLIINFPPGQYRFSQRNHLSKTGVNAIEITSASQPQAELIFDPPLDGWFYFFMGSSFQHTFIHDITASRDTHGKSMYTLSGSHFMTGNYNADFTKTYQNITTKNFTSSFDSVTNTMIKHSNISWGAHGVHLPIENWTDLGDGRYSTSTSGTNNCRVLLVDGEDRLDKATDIFLTNGSWYNCIRSGDTCVTQDGGQAETLYFRPDDGALDTEEIYCGHVRSALGGVSSYNYYRDNYWKGYEQGHGHCIYTGGNLLEHILYSVGNYFGGPYHRSGSCFETFGFEQMYVYDNVLKKASVHPGSPQHAEWIDNNLSDIGFLPGHDSNGTNFTFTNNCMDRTTSTGEGFIFRGNLTHFNSMSIENNTFGSGIPNSPWAIYDFDLNRDPSHENTCGACVHGKYNDPNPNVPGDCDSSIASCIDVSGCTCGEWQGNVNSDAVCETTDPGPFEFIPPAIQSAGIIPEDSDLANGIVTLDLVASDAGSGLDSTPRFPYQEGGLIQASADGVVWSKIYHYNTNLTITLNQPITDSLFVRVRDRDGNWTDSTPVTLSATLPGDYEPPENPDGDVDIHDFWEVVLNFIQNAYTIFDFNQVVSNFNN